MNHVEFLRRSVSRRTMLGGLGASAFTVSSVPISLIIGSPGTYNNLTNWPSIGANGDTANRPVFAAGTLSWTGPLGGGPSTATDVAQTLSLTPSSSTIRSSANGQTISGFDAQNGIGITHNNVTISKSHIFSNGYPGTAVNLAVGVTGTVVEDCELDLGADSSGNYAIAPSDVSALVSGLTIRRCNIHGCEKFFGSQRNQNCLYIDNYVSRPSGSDCDICACWFTSHDVTIKHNYAQYDPNSFDSLANITNYDGGSTGGTDPISNIIVDNNGLNGYTTHWIICDSQYNGGSLATFSGMQLTNNGFFGTGIYSAISASPGIVANSGNFVMASATATSGTPTNGDGHI